jgi:hypothetical protein
MKELYQITLSYACAGIIVENDIVKETAPIFHWMKGKNINEVKSWVNKKSGTIIKVK